LTLEPDELSLRCGLLGSAEHTEIVEPKSIACVARSICAFAKGKTTAERLCGQGPSYSALSRHILENDGVVPAHCC